MKSEPGLYDYWPYVDRPKITWPDGKKVAFWVAPNIEFYELKPPKNPHRGSWPRPYPDITPYSYRDYGNRVGNWRLMEAMDDYGVRGSISLSVAMCQHHPEIIQACADRPAGQAGSGTSTSDDLTAQGRIASLRGNVLRPGASVPRVIGTHRIFPPLLVEPLVDIDNNVETIESIFGLSGPHALSDLRIGSSPVSEMDEVSVELSEGLPGSVAPSLISRFATTENVSVAATQLEVDPAAGTNLLDQGNPSASLGVFHRFVSAVDPDEIWINVDFVGGFYEIATPSRKIKVVFRIRMRKRGATTWRNLPELHYSGAGVIRTQNLIKIKFTDAPTIKQAPAAGSAGEGFHLAFSRTRLTDQTEYISPDGQWVADSIFSTGESPTVDEYYDSTNYNTTSQVENVDLFGDRADIYFPVADKGQYEIEIKRSGVVREADFAEATYLTGGTLLDLFGYRDQSGTFVFFRSQLLYSSVIAYSRLMSVYNETPVLTDDFALIHLKVTGRQLTELSMLASGYVKDWDGTGWNTLTITSNPAPHFYAVLTGQLSRDPVPTDIVDSDELVVWRSYCDSISPPLEANAVVEGLSGAEVLSLIASAGYSRPRQSERWGIITDKDRSAEDPVQMFSPRNMNGFGWEKAFGALPDGFRVTYNNSALDYDEDELIVLDPLGDGSTNKLEAIAYSAIVTEEAVRERAQFDLKQGRYRMTFYSGEVSAESIVSKRGDLVAVQHDTLDNHAGFARIKTIVRAGSPSEEITGLVLDGTITVDQTGFFLDDETVSPSGQFFTDQPGSPDENFFIEPRLGVAIRGNDGVFTVREATGGELDEDTISFVSPITDTAGRIVTGALIVSGELDREYKRMIIADIVYKEDMTAQLTFVNEAPEIFQ